MPKFADAFCTGELESVTLTVNEAVPAMVGVPVICPEPFSVKPCGRKPALTDQVYGAVPPLAASAVEYGLFACPEGREPAEIASPVGPGPPAWTGVVTTPAQPDNIHRVQDIRTTDHRRTLKPLEEENSENMWGPMLVSNYTGNVTYVLVQLATGPREGFGAGGGAKKLPVREGRN